MPSAWLTTTHTGPKEKYKRSRKEKYKREVQKRSTKEKWNIFFGGGDIFFWEGDIFFVGEGGSSTTNVPCFYLPTTSKEIKKKKSEVHFFLSFHHSQKSGLKRRLF